MAVSQPTIPGIQQRLRPYDVTAFGATGDGATNDTAAVLRAIDAAEAGGGAVYFPAGKTYIVEGLPLRDGLHYHGDGAVLKLPEEPTASMFLSTGNIEIHSGSIVGLELDGRDKSQHGIDFSSMTRLDAFTIYRCYIHHFDRGYNGSNSNDRWPYISNCRFWSNNIGAYGNEHPIIDHCDFRVNDIGLSGRLNDFYAVGCKFGHNRIGVVAAPGQTINNCHFVGCSWFQCLEIGIIVNNRVRLTNCQFVGINDGDVGVRVLGVRNLIIGCIFGQAGADTSYGFACIEVKVDSSVHVTACHFDIYAGPALLVSGFTAWFLQFNGNIIDSYSTSTAPAIKASGSGSRCSVCQFNDNYYTTRATSFFDGDAVNSQFVGNHLIAQSAAVSGGLLKITAGGSLGNLIASNQATSAAGGSGMLLRGTSGASSIIGNRLSGSVTFGDMTIASTAIVSANTGGIGSNGGSATIDDGQSTEVITHGLVSTPTSVTVTPQGDDRLWVTSVGSTTFTVNRSGSSGNLAFYWRAER